MAEKNRDSGGFQNHFMADENFYLATESYQ